MNISSIEQYLKYFSKKHEIYSQNIANINTPKYQAFELESAQSFMSRMQHDPVSLAITHINHLEGRKNSNFRVNKQKDVYEIKPNGNNVSLADQTQKIAKNQLDYNAALEAYSKANSLIVMSLGKGN